MIGEGAGEQGAGLRHGEQKLLGKWALSRSTGAAQVFKSVRNSTASFYPAGDDCGRLPQVNQLTLAQCLFNEWLKIGMSLPILLLLDRGAFANFNQYLEPERPAVDTQE